MASPLRSVTLMADLLERGFSLDKGLKILIQVKTIRRGSSSLLLQVLLLLLFPGPWLREYRFILTLSYPSM